MFRSPNYFFAVFGEAHWEEAPVDGGTYVLEASYSSRIALGDVVLLYCLDDAPEHQNEIPGIGVVTSLRESGGFDYQYLPFCHPIAVDWDTMKIRLPELEPPGNRIFYWKGNFMRQISNNSFRATIAGRQVDWP